MKKLLIIVLGMLMFNACSDDLGGEGFDDPNKIPDDATHFEKLETPSIKIESLRKNLGDFQLGTAYKLNIKITNKRPDVAMQLIVSNIRNRKSYVDKDYGTCEKGTISGIDYIAQPPISSCELTFNLVINNTDNEGSPFVVDFLDANMPMGNPLEPQLSVVLYYNIK